MPGCSRRSVCSSPDNAWPFFVFVECFQISYVSPRYRNYDYIFGAVELSKIYYVTCTYVRITTVCIYVCMHAECRPSVSLSKKKEKKFFHTLATICTHFFFQSQS